MHKTRDLGWDFAARMIGGVENHSTWTNGQKGFGRHVRGVSEVASNGMRNLSTTACSNSLADSPVEGIGCHTE